MRVRVVVAAVATFAFLVSGCSGSPQDMSMGVREAQSAVGTLGRHPREPLGVEQGTAVGRHPDLVEVRPALEMERLFETVISLAKEGRCLRSGMPKPLDLALFVREFRREVRAPFPPPLAVRAALAPLAWVAERRGRDLQPAELTPSFA